MPKTSERIELLERRLKQLKAKQQKSDARKRALESRQTRRDDTRRKILAGAIVLARIESDAEAKVRFYQWLAVSLTREEDRALFDLPTVAREPATAGVPSQRDPKTADGFESANSSGAENQP
jgi:hypothetical protein